MENKKETSFLRHLLRHPMITAIFGTLIGGLVTYQVTAINVEKATVELMSSRLSIVEKNDTLEQAINDINNAIKEKNEEIDSQSELLKKKEEQIAELTNQLNDDTELKKLNEQLDALQKEKDKLQTNYDELISKGYEEYIKSTQSLPISLSTIACLKNEDVRTVHSGSTSVGGVPFSYYIDTKNDNVAYIEYNLDNKYSQFKGKAYISRWAYENFDASASVIRNASISIQVKYNNTDDYQEIDNISGLTADSDPVEIGGSLIGVMRLKIVFRGGGAYANGYSGGVIHLGEPALYKAVTE